MLVITSKLRCVFAQKPKLRQLTYMYIKLKIKNTLNCRYVFCPKRFDKIYIFPFSMKEL